MSLSPRIPRALGASERPPNVRACHNNPFPAPDPPRGHRPAGVATGAGAGGAKLSRLHDIFQAAMGWTNSHLHTFTYRRTSATEPTSTSGPKMRSTRRSTPSSFSVAGGQRRFFYEYDFGDGWAHEVVVEEITWSSYVLKHAGVHRRRRSLSARGRRWHRAMRTSSRRWPIRTHEEHDSYLEWVGFVRSVEVQSGGRQHGPPEGPLNSFLGLSRPVERRRKLSVPVSMMWAR